MTNRRVHIENLIEKWVKSRNLSKHGKLTVFLYKGKIAIKIYFQKNNINIKVKKRYNNEFDDNYEFIGNFSSFFNNLKKENQEKLISIMEEKVIKNA